MSPPKVERWVLTPHAAIRMEERGISPSELALVVEHPDLAIPQGPKWIFAKRLAGRRDNLVAAVLLERKERGVWVVLSVLVRFEKRR